MSPDPSSLCSLIESNRIPGHLYKAETSPTYQVPIARVLFFAPGLSIRIDLGATSHERQAAPGKSPIV